MADETELSGNEFAETYERVLQDGRAENPSAKAFQEIFLGWVRAGKPKDIEGFIRGHESYGKIDC